MFSIQDKCESYIGLHWMSNATYPLIPHHCAEINSSLKKGVVVGLEENKEGQEICKIPFYRQ